ncbi:MAG: hypothetical protein AAF960_07505 [Bacteroidota bacterium]
MQFFYGKTHLPYLLLFICLNFLTKSLSAQAPHMTLWWTEATHTKNGHDHHQNHNHDVLFPCDTTYYYYFDGQDDHIIMSIKNEGDAPLTLSLPLSLGTNSSAEYSIVQQPDKSILQPQEETIFKVKYTAPDFYRSAKASVIVQSNAPISPACTLNLQVGFLDLFWNIITGRDLSILGFSDLFLEQAYESVQNPAPAFCFATSKNKLEVNDGGTIDSYFLETQQVFNNNGQLISAVKIDSSTNSGQRDTAKTTNQYDASGHLIATTVEFTNAFFFSPSDGVTRTTTYTNDKNGRWLSSEVVFQQKGTSLPDFISTVQNTYDENGRLIKETISIKGQSPSPIDGLFTFHYTYNSMGQLIKERLTVEEGFVDATIERTFTYAGNQLLSTTNLSILQFSSSVDTTKTTETFTYAGNRLASSTAIDERPLGTQASTIVTKYLYDAMGILVEQNSLQSGGLFDSAKDTTTFTLGTCTMTQPSISDPCNCEDPLNRKDRNGQITHFHDVLSVRGFAGQTVTLTSGNTNFLGANLQQIPNNTVLGIIPATGLLTYDFYHASGASGDITVSVGGTTLPPFAVSVCSSSDCTIIPTFSQWGLVVFGLLVLNMGLFIVRRYNM